ncbi:hypothetical protein V8E53_015889 [Lactarius tabidus]
MTSRDELPIAPPDVIILAAPLIFGPLFNWALYGVLCVQIYVYRYNFPGDPRSLKCLAYFVLALETAQTALTGADAYYWFVAGYGNVQHLAHSHFAPIDISIMTAVASLIVQGYFCFRIWKASRRLSWICLVVAVSAVPQFIGAVWGGIESFINGKYVVSKIPAYLWSVPSAMADVLIAVTMTLLLRKASDELTDFKLTRVIRLAIETNSLTVFTALILYAAFPNYAYLTEVIGKLYSNTLLVGINNRIYSRSRQSAERSGLPVSNRVLSTAATSIHFAGTVSGLQAPTEDSFQIGTPCIQTVGLEQGKGDDASVEWSVSHRAQPSSSFLQ